jgi:hypothetical protein
MVYMVMSRSMPIPSEGLEGDCSLTPLRVDSHLNIGYMCSRPEGLTASICRTSTPWGYVWPQSFTLSILTFTKLQWHISKRDLTHKLASTLPKTDHRHPPVPLYFLFEASKASRTDVFRFVSAECQLSIVWIASYISLIWKVFKDCVRMTIRRSKTLMVLFRLLRTVIQCVTAGLPCSLLDQCLFQSYIPDLTCNRMMQFHLVVDPRQVSGASLLDGVSPMG